MQKRTKANEEMNERLRLLCSPGPGPSGQACSRLASRCLCLHPSALPSVLINIRTSVQTVVVGHAVEFECLALGDPKPQVTWSKVGGRLRPGIVQSGGIVRIAHVELADAGQYRCTATNAAGTTQSHVLLLVQGEGCGDVCGGRGAWPGFLVLLSPALPALCFLSTLLGSFVCAYLRGRFHNKWWQHEIKVSVPLGLAGTCREKPHQGASRGK